MSNSLWPYVLQPARVVCPRDSPGKNTGLGYHFLLQGIFLTQGSNPCLLAPSALAGRFFTLWVTGEAQMLHCCCCWVAQSRLTLFDPVDCNKPGFPVLLSQARGVCDTRQPPRPLSPLSPSLCCINKWQQLLLILQVSAQGLSLLCIWSPQVSPFHIPTASGAAFSLSTYHT